jgi:hypothetical protein
MKRTIVSAFLGLALTASFAVGSTSVASASNECGELLYAELLHHRAGNTEYANQLRTWYYAYGC